MRRRLWRYGQKRLGIATACDRWSPVMGTPSDDTLNRGLDGLGPRPVRCLLVNVFAHLVRLQALPPALGLWTIIRDRHASHASSDHGCPACVQRRMTTRTGERIK